MSFISSGLRYHQEEDEEHFYQPEAAGYYVAAPAPPPVMFRPPPVTVAYASVVYGPPLMMPTWQPPPPPPVAIPRLWPTNSQCFVDNYGRIFSYEHRIEEEQCIGPQQHQQQQQQQQEQGPLMPLTYHYVVKSPVFTVHSQYPSSMPEQRESRSHKRKHHEPMGHHRHHHHQHHQHHHQLKIVDITYGEEKAEVLMGKRVSHSSLHKSPAKTKRRHKATAGRVYVSEEGYLVEEPQESGDEEPTDGASQ